MCTLGYVFHPNLARIIPAGRFVSPQQQDSLVDGISSALASFTVHDAKDVKDAFHQFEDLLLSIKEHILGVPEDCAVIFVERCYKIEAAQTDEQHEHMRKIERQGITNKDMLDWCLVHDWTVGEMVADATENEEDGSAILSFFQSFYSPYYEDLSFEQKEHMCDLETAEQLAQTEETVLFSIRAIEGAAQA